MEEVGPTPHQEDPAQQTHYEKLVANTLEQSDKILSFDFNNIKTGEPIEIDAPKVDVAPVHEFNNNRMNFVVLTSILFVGLAFVLIIAFYAKRNTT